MEYVIIGAGSRGMTYGQWIKDNNMEITVTISDDPAAASEDMKTYL